MPKVEQKAKVDLNTERASHVGVHILLEIVQSHKARATGAIWVEESGLYAAYASTSRL